METIVQSILFLLPAMAANTTPIVASGLKLFEFLNIPIDEKRLGRNKTWRGFIVGTLCAMAMAFLLFFVHTNYPHLDRFFIFKFHEEGLFRTLFFGFAQAIGILGMDSIKSYFKRRLGIAPGRPLPFFDQIDLYGAVFIGLAFVEIPMPVLLLCLIAGPIVPAVLNVCAFHLKLKKVPY